MTIRLIVSLLAFLISFNSFSQKKWWLDEPVRLLQTNLPIQMVPDYDPQELVDQVVASGANTWLFNVGGIYAYYPTEIKDHAINPFMDPQRDFAGELIKLAKENNIRVIGRFDFSRFTTDIAERHMDWAFRRANGDTIMFNGLVTSCVFGDYYQKQAEKIIEEGMSRYQLDGLLVNWWGNHGTNGYTGIPNGVCHCESCQKSWAKNSKEPFPQDFTPEYHTWHNAAKNNLVGRLLKVIAKYSDNTALIMHHMTGDWNQGEGFTTETSTRSESNDWWLYQSSYYLSKYRNSYPDQALFNTVVDFINYNFRFAPHRTQVIQTRMIQSIAHGGFPAFYQIGMPNQLDTTGAAAIVRPFQIHKQNESHYLGQKSAAEITLIDDGLSESMKGIINILSEAHIPYKIIKEEKISDHAESTKLFIATGPVSDLLLTEVEKGKNVISIGTEVPSLLSGDLVKNWNVDDTRKSYWWVQDSVLFPRLSKHEIIFNPSAFAELKADATAPIVMIPPARSTPPELVWSNMKNSDKPGLVIKDHGKGKMAYIPWDASAVYFQHATTSIRILFEELIDHLNESRQIYSDAHPAVEISLMKKNDGTHLLHLINNTGQLHGFHNQVIPFSNIEIKVKGEFQKISTAQNIPLNFRTENGFTVFLVPELSDYEMIVLQK